MAAADLARTPLHARHRALGARMVPFAGWEMPLQYAGILEEHRAVRRAAGLFDVSHMGRLRVRGPGAAGLVSWLCTNDPGGLVPGRAMYTPMCDPHGGTVDDCIVYCLEPGTDYLFVVNAANTASDRAWMAEHGRARAPAAAVEDASAGTALLALQGPRAAALLARLLEPPRAAELARLRPFRFWPCVPVAGRDCLVSRTGYTGEDGFEIACAAEAAPGLWDALLAEGDREGAVPAGLGARDTLRLEAGLPLYGHELGPGVNPLEAGLERFVRLEGREFCGADALRAVARAGPARRLVGLLPEPPAIARAGAPVTGADGEPVGEVTSGTYAPTLGRAAAMALCRAGAAPPGARLSVRVRGRQVPAEAVALPFYRRQREAKSG